MDPSLCFAKRLSATNQADGHSVNRMVRTSYLEPELVWKQNINWWSYWAFNHVQEYEESAIVAPVYPGIVAPVYPYVPPAAPADEVQDWPHDSVLTARLKKLIQLLPSGSGGREVSKAVPKSHKRRATDTRCEFGLWQII